MTQHSFRQKTIFLCFRIFLFLKSDVYIHIKSCDVCAADKPPSKTTRAPMGTIKTEAPLGILATDYIGPLPCTPRCNRYIRVLTDCLGKYVEVIPAPDQTAETCATKIPNAFIAQWGCPFAILSDQCRKGL